MLHKSNTVSSCATVERWAAHYKICKESLEDDDRSGRPTAATAEEENIAHVHRIVMDDRRLTVNQIAHTVSISRERVVNILHNESRLVGWLVVLGLTAL